MVFVKHMDMRNTQLKQLCVVYNFELHIIGYGDDIIQRILGVRAKWTNCHFPRRRKSVKGKDDVLSAFGLAARNRPGVRELLLKRKTSTHTQK